LSPQILRSSGVGYALGIDLGTTFSAAGLTRDGRTEIFSLGNRAATLPSVVVLREDGEVLIGDAAVRRSLTEPMRTAREFKRRLGDPTPIMLGGTPYGAESLMARLLDGIVRQVVEQQGEDPTQIVVSHPANYGPYKLDLLEQAVRMAEIGKVTFIPEPVAAALHYTERERIEPGEIVAVYDFGGGTFDAALLRKTADGFEVLGEPEGIERLGGVDFDEAVFAHVVGALGARWQELDPTDQGTVSAVARLRDDCREAKEGLSVDTDATIPVMLPTIQTEVRITRGEFEEMIRPRIHETISALQRAIRSAGVEVSDVSKVLLVGGSSRIPLVGQMVREATSLPIAIDAHPKHAIALGAALAASQTPDRPSVAAVAPVPDAPAPLPSQDSKPEPVAPVPSESPPAATAVPVGAAASWAPAAADSPVHNSPAAPAPPVSASVDGGGGGSSAPVSQAASGDGSRLPFTQLLIGGVLVVVLLGGIGTFLALQYFGGDDDQDVDGIAGVLVGDATEMPDAEVAADPTATVAPDPTATEEATRDTSVAAAPTETSVPATATATPTLAPTATRTPAPTRTPRPDTPTPTVEPTRTPPVPPGVEFAHILDIKWNQASQRYEIDFEMYELDINHPDGIDDPNTSQFARPHVHFFVNTVAPEQAGVPGGGPWKLYAGPAPYDGFTAADIPGGATEICVLIANADHSVRQDTGNCFALPPSN
jgi:molecular chaperone DnaK